MKSKILAATLLSVVLVTSSFANKSNHLNVTREIIITASFQKIVVGDNINVVLIQDANRSTISVFGDVRSVQYVETNIVKDQLKISSKKSLQGKKITVYIPVKNLSAIELSEGSSVSGQGVLKFDDLTVLINGDCHVVLNTWGTINIKSSDNFDFVYEKNEKYKVISATL